MEDSTYCFRLGEDASSLQHMYWGPGIASAQAIEMSHATAPLRIAFESPMGGSGQVTIELGAEVFVVDDGWFEGRYHDNAGLGDWTVDVKKISQGLNPLITRVNAL